ARAPRRARAGEDALRGARPARDPGARLARRGGRAAPRALRAARRRGRREGARRGRRRPLNAAPAVVILRSRRTAMKSVNPATGDVLKEYPDHGEAEVEARLARAAAVFRTWRRTPFAERSRSLRAAGDLLDGEKERLGR